MVSVFLFPFCFSNFDISYLELKDCGKLSELTLTSCLNGGVLEEKKKKLREELSIPCLDG